MRVKEEWKNIDSDLNYDKCVVLWLQQDAGYNIKKYVLFNFQNNFVEVLLNSKLIFYNFIYYSFKSDLNKTATT